MTTLMLQLRNLAFNGQTKQGRTMTEYRVDPDEDVLIRMQHDNGVIVTFLTAPQELFSDRENLSPLVFWLDENEVFLAFDEDELNKMIHESVLLNGNIYGYQAAAFLPIQHILQIGLTMIGQQIDGN
jgi:hypothetical protein